MRPTVGQILSGLAVTGVASAMLAAPEHVLVTHDEQSSPPLTLKTADQVPMPASPCRSTAPLRPARSAPEQRAVRRVAVRAPSVEPLARAQPVHRPQPPPAGTRTPAPQPQPKPEPPPPPRADPPPVVAPPVTVDDPDPPRERAKKKKRKWRGRNDDKRGHGRQGGGDDDDSSGDDSSHGDDSDDDD